MGDPNDPRGTVQEFKDARGRKYYKARITLPDGERVWLKPRFDRRERAAEYADDKSREAGRRGLTVAKAARVAPGQTCDDWHEDYLRACQAAGLATVKDKRGRWSKWISPHIGDKAPKQLTRDDVENVRDAIDDAIRAFHEKGRGRTHLAPKSGGNVWGELTVSLREMFSSKRRELRVLDVDLTAGVQPPETGGGERLKCYPYPSEAVMVAACDAVPLAWRETHMVAVYTYARPGELRVLEWRDVDLDGQQIRITKAWDYQNARVKKTKTHENRTIPIHANLLPLLRIMKRRASGKGAVLPLLSQVDDEQGLADTTRKHFALAGCSEERVERFNLDTSAELPLRFRSWRDAGCTWAIVDGLDVVKVQRRAGHKLIGTTMKYVVEAENRSAAFGSPFPPLPLSLLRASKESSKSDVQDLEPTGTTSVQGCERRELNPHESYLART